MKKGGNIDSINKKSEFYCRKKVSQLNAISNLNTKYLKEEDNDIEFLSSIDL
jgi:hypothetical protein